MINQDATPQSEPETVESSKRLWGPWATAGFGIVIGTVIMSAQIILVAVYTVIKIMTELPFYFSELFLSIRTDGFLISISGLLSAIVGIGLIAIIIKARRGYSISEYLGIRALSTKAILILLPLAGVFTLISFLLSYIPGRSDSEFIEYILQAYSTSVLPVLFWLNIVVFAPVLEESIFRGFLFAGFRQSRIGITGTIIITSMIWTLLHLGQYDIYDMGSLFVFGVILGILRQRTNSLWSPLIAHLLNNLIAMFFITLGTNNYAG